LKEKRLSIKSWDGKSSKSVRPRIGAFG